MHPYELIGHLQELDRHLNGGDSDMEDEERKELYEENFA